MRPEQRRYLGLENPARDGDAFRFPDRFVTEPARRLVGGCLPYGFVPPWPRGAPGVLGVEDPLAPTAPVDQLELVLEAVDLVGGRRGQFPAAAVSGQLVRQPFAQLMR